ncbi:dTDP-4-dehydrorhamnose 3,5-epimerase family protein [Cohnella sp. CBP 2801]|uniref:dTDP-4-dehydrorhamnose 3,5-epimerase family protein n=1 Tax=Cohnella zeiphila TaxID=2761120 RepID=A0A7X0SLJ4_9BACL|nr:dTDP-4-dehydrorhamnose 3,5-epimerase family protein [Cohnella zeiphila]MBB6732238.1 dTDP-4-dehydrorhamnose 3,5-epimerase family protein [Cohnella zeiphila]
MWHICENWRGVALVGDQIELIRGGLAVDDRGSLRFVNDFSFAEVKRFYQVENHRQGFIRAWHGHEREGKYVYAVSGSALIGAVPLAAAIGDLAAVKKVVLSEQSPAVLWIPPGYYNGFMSLTVNTKLMFFSTSTLEESRGDDIRKDYDTWNIWQEDFR